MAFDEQSSEPSAAANLVVGEPPEREKIEAEVCRGIARSFELQRCFTIPPDVPLIERLRSGARSEQLGPDYRRLRQDLFERAAGGAAPVEQLFGGDARLSVRLSDALRHLHEAIAASGSVPLAGRRFVLVRSERGTAGLPGGDDSRVVVARIGKGPHWLELPSIYLPLRLLDLLTDEEQHDGRRLFDAFVHLLAIEERAIETGYAHLEELPPAARGSVAELALALTRLARDREARLDRTAPPVQGPPERVRPFTRRRRARLLGWLDARRSDDDASFDHYRTREAIEELRRLARRYKRVGDRDSLREIVRLLTAASGHDLHEVRDRANELLERVFAAKPFDAPPATSFRTVRRGSPVHFAFDLVPGSGSYLLLIFHGGIHGGLCVERELVREEVKLSLDSATRQFYADCVFEECGTYDYAVVWKTRRSLQWVSQRRCSGRVSVLPDVSGEIVLEIFPDIHGHTRIYWRAADGHPGLVYNENGEVIRTGRFSDITAHLPDILRRYRVTALYILGAQRRGRNREDWAPSATSPSPFAPMSLSRIEDTLGGEGEFRELVEEAHRLDIKIIIDVIPHLNRSSLEVPDDWRVRCYDQHGSLVVRAATDGRYGEWNDGALMNYRKFEVWEWLADSVLELIERYDIDGIRFDSAHAVPIMMKRDARREDAGYLRSAEEVVEGTIVSNEREDDHFVTTGFYDCACCEDIANPFHTYLVGRVEALLRRRHKRSFLYIAECYWGRERYLARSGIIPYNSALFKICEQIVQGSCDVRAIYHLYDRYYPQALPPGTKLLGIFGNHDESRALHTFGEHALRAVLGITSFLNTIILDYDGSAEGQAWKVYLDNVYVDWNQFDYAANRSVALVYREIYDFHRANPGRGHLVWANNPLVAAAMKEGPDALTLGMFNFSNENQHVALQFDNPALPIVDDRFYRLVDPLYSSVTHQCSYFTGRELRTARIETVVPYTDRMKFLRLETVPEPEGNYADFLRDSMVRLCSIAAADHFASNFAFGEIAAHREELISFLRERLLPLFDREHRPLLELGVKRALFHLQRRGYSRGRELRGLIERLCEERDPALRSLGLSLERANEPGPIVFLSAEAEPFSKFGGLANVVYELPRELARLGEEVYVVTPRYRTGEPRAVEKMNRALTRWGVSYTGRNVTFKIGENAYEVGVHAAVVDGVRYFLLDHHEFFDGLYWGVTAEERLRRRIGFIRASAEVIASFGLRPIVTFTNDAYAGPFNAVVRLDPYYAHGASFERTSFIHLVHNGGWQYWDSYLRYERGADLFGLFNLPSGSVGEFLDPVDGAKLNCMAAGVRCADRVITVSPAYARELARASDGMECLLHDVVGINNAIGRGFSTALRRRFAESGFVERWYPALLDRAGRGGELRESLERRYPSVLDGPHACEHLEDRAARERDIRMRNKLLLQLREGLSVDPDRVLFCMIHRVVEQKGFSLLLSAAEALFGKLGLEGIVGGPVSHGDRRSEELACALEWVSDSYPHALSVRLGFCEIAVPLLSCDVFLMPSQYEPGGIAQLEALSAGCLIVARATGGLRDTVSPIRATARGVHGNGFLFTDFTREAFVDAMERCAAFVCESGTRRLAMARQNARRSVHYWDESALRYLEEIYSLKEIIRPEPSRGSGPTSFAALHGSVRNPEAHEAEQNDHPKDPEHPEGTDGAKKRAG